MATIGRTLGEKCPACKKGALQAVMRQPAEEPFGLHTVIGMRTRAKEAVIERLACSKCSASFEATQRGETDKGILIPQVTAYKGKKRQPKTCAHCAKKLVSKVYDPHGDHMDALEVGRPLRSDEGPRGPHLGSQKYLYCDGCLVVAWVGPKLGYNPKLLKVVRKEILALRKAKKTHAQP